MKTLIQLRKEANERAFNRSFLSTDRKLALAIMRCGVHSPNALGWNREVNRLAIQLKEEDTQARLSGKVVIPATKCEARKR